MPVTEPVELAGSAHDARPVSLCGWGRVAASSARVRSVVRTEDVVEALSGLPRTRVGVGAASVPRAGLIARGAGRSYGDAAQIASGEVLDMRGLDGILALDRDLLIVTAQAGVTLARLLNHLASLDLTLPVVPGTRYVTVGGALASDIHGKSHHCDGSLARHVRSIALCLPGGDVVEISPQADRELFDATLGGMGLTGVIVHATLAVEPLSSPWVAEDLDRTEDIEQTLALLSDKDTSRWSVAWLDLLAGGGRLGRALVSRADPWPEASGVACGDGVRAPSGGVRAPSGRARSRWAALRAWRREDGLELFEEPRLDVPRRFPSGVLRPPLVRGFNAARWRSPTRRVHVRARRVGLGAYLFPLDALGGWNRLYGRQGLVQYQLVVPPGREGELVRCVELLRARRIPVYLAVLKGFGPGASGPLSFPIEGFTLALDIPGGADGLRPALNELDQIVAEAAGRVYLSKDVRLRKDVLPAMYPQLDRFLQVRARADPAGVLRSDLGMRLGLCEIAP
jgi:decaprenylphospho-beta-D-ribofuranose 2-oxidase